MDLHIFHSPEETQDWARRFARCLKAGDVIALVGALGSGKTTLAQGIARGWGYQGGAISPTFALVNEYRSRQGLLLHMDMYRLTFQELMEFPLDDYLDSRSVCLIEWADRIRGRWPGETLELRLSARGPNIRELRIIRPPSKWSERLKNINNQAA